MLEKNIKSTIRKNISNWLESIDDKDVKDSASKDTIVCGGALVSLMLNETPNDYDVYFRTKETALKVANYYVNKWKEEHKGGCFVKVIDCDAVEEGEEDNNLGNKGRIKIVVESVGIAGDINEDSEEINASEELGDNIDDLMDIADDTPAEELERNEKKVYDPVFISSNAITLKGGIQIIVRFYGSPDEIHDTFDFEHTKSYYDYGNKKVDIPRSVYECVMNKRLKYTGSKYPIASVFRLRKFLERGWRINAGQILKIMMNAQEFDLTDINTLEDQLIGVDTLYFQSIIDALRKKMYNDKDFNLTSSYVMSIVDKVF